MYALPNLREFYEKPLIPIAKSERHVIDQGIYKNDNTLYTHWLFALIGEPKEKDSQVYQWQVAIYPSTHNRQVNYQRPFYLSDFFECFHKAESFASMLSEKAQQHCLLAELEKENPKMA